MIMMLIWTKYMHVKLIAKDFQAEKFLTFREATRSKKKKKKKKKDMGVALIEKMQIARFKLLYSKKRYIVHCGRHKRITTVMLETISTINTLIMLIYNSSFEISANSDILKGSQLGVFSHAIVYC